MTELHLFLCIVFVLATVYFLIYAKSGRYEGFSSNGARCPNLLIKKDNVYYLENSRLAKVPGVNPLKFNSLEEYKQFLNWQKANGINCPVLFLQRTYDAQGESVYKMHDTVSEIQGGLPSIRQPPNPAILQADSGSVVYSSTFQDSLPSVSEQTPPGSPKSPSHPKHKQHSAWSLLDEAMKKIEHVFDPSPDENMLYKSDTADAMNAKFIGEKRAENKVNNTHIYDGNFVYKLEMPDESN